MTDTPMPDPDFPQLVRSALAHLYDFAYLQNHPLALRMLTREDLDNVSRSQALRRVLLDCVEDIRPKEQARAPDEASRPYVVLTYRYVDGLSIDEIAGKLAISRRQAYREHDKGIRAVSSLLWDHIDRLRQEQDPEPPSDSPPDPRRDVVRSEVDRLRSAVNTVSLDLQNVLAEVISTVGPLANRERIALSVDWPESERSTIILADRVMLRQALLNVLGSAIAGTEVGEVRITVGSERGAVTLNVTPVGHASIDPHLERSESEPADVNLRVARILIEAQGGHLQMLDDSPNGIRAEIRLATLQDTTILVIDDNTDMIALLRRYLGGHDVAVMGATEGASATRLAKQIGPQLIILDVMIPTVDGWEILQALKRMDETQGIPVIVCSVLNQVEMALAMGASDYILKPVSQVTLLRVLRRWLGALRPIELPPGE